MTALLSKVIGFFLVILLCVVPAQVALASDARVEALPDDSPYNALAAELSRTIASALGVAPLPDIVLAGLYGNPQLADLLDVDIPADTQVMAAALPVFATGADGPGWAPQRQSLDATVRNRMDTCAILLHIRFELESDLLKRVYLAHELTHCYQMKLAPNLAVFKNIPVWLREGSAEFVGEDVNRVGSPALPPYWNEYFRRNVPLFGRSYDAMGLFFHIKHRGVDPYLIVRELMSSYIDDPTALQWIRSTMGARNFSSWPMSLSRQATWGADWDTSGPAITTARANAELVSLTAGADYNTSVAPGETPLYEIVFPSDRILQLQLAGYGGIRWNPSGTDGRTDFFEERAHGSYCVEGGCRCPDGSLPPGVTEVPSGGGENAVAVLAITGDGHRGSIAASIVDLPACPTTTESCALLTVTSSESKQARDGLCGRALVEGDCVVGLWRADSEVYEQQIKSRLPTQMIVVEARNDTMLSIAEPGQADACIHFVTRTEMSGPVSLSTHTYADGASVSVLGLQADNVLCAIPVKEEVEVRATTNIGGVETEQPVPIDTKPFPRESMIECTRDRLKIHGPNGQYSEFIRIQ